MVNRIARQAWLIVSNERDAILSRNVLRGYNHELVPGDAGVECDFLDSAAGNLAANRRAIKHSRQNHIVNVHSFSGYFLAPLFARNRSTDDAFMVHDSTLLRDMIRRSATMR